MLTSFFFPHQLDTLAWLCAASCLLMILAQQPIATYRMAFTTIDEKTLFIHRGMSKGLSSAQFFSLDLTQDNWDVSNPPWKALDPDSFSKNLDIEGHALSVSLDGRTLTAWIGAENLTNYNVVDNKWTKGPVPGFILAPMMSVDTDPKTGTVYIPQGIQGNFETLLKYNVASGFTTEPIPSFVKLGLSKVKFVWSKVRKSFILQSIEDMSTYPFYEYTPSNGQWKVLVRFTELKSRTSQCLLLTLLVEAMLTSFTSIFR
jgi:hypothetical protein